MVVGVCLTLAQSEATVAPATSQKLERRELPRTSGTEYLAWFASARRASSTRQSTAHSFPYPESLAGVRTSVLRIAIARRT